MGTVIERVCQHSRILARLVRRNIDLNRRTAVDLAHQIHGSCSPGSKHVFVLHGLLGSKKNWQSISKRIAAELNTCTVVVDARNHGDSPHTSTHSYPELASDVAKLMDKLSVTTADMIGHSMGGRTAMVLALTQEQFLLKLLACTILNLTRARKLANRLIKKSCCDPPRINSASLRNPEPKRVSRLTVVDISPVSTAGILNDFFPRLIDVLKTVQFEGAKNVNQARSVAKDKILASGVMSSMEGMDFILMNLVVKPDKTFRWAINLDTLKNSFQDIASFPKEMENKQFKGPTLFIGGEKSNYLPPSDLDGIKQMFPNAQLKYIPGVGHNVHAEDPKTFFNFVKEFMNS